MAPPPYLPELAPYAATCPIPSVWVDRSYYEFVDVAAGRTFAVETKHWDPADPDGWLDQAVQKLGGYSPSAPAVYPHAHFRMRGTALPSRAPNTKPELRVVTMAWENQFRVVSVTGPCSEQALIELVAGWAPAPTAPSVDDQAKFWSRPTWNALGILIPKLPTLRPPGRFAYRREGASLVCQFDVQSLPLPLDLSPLFQDADAIRAAGQLAYTEQTQGVVLLRELSPRRAGVGDHCFVRQAIWRPETRNQQGATQLHGLLAFHLQCVGDLRVAKDLELSWNGLVRGTYPLAVRGA